MITTAPATGCPDNIMSPAMRGFNLIELMIVLAILAIVVALGYPSYRDQIKKSRRTEGMAQLLELADRMERAYTDQASYPDQIDALYHEATAGDFYTLAIIETDSISFKISATPTPRGAQDTDKCGTFILTSLGERSVSGSLPVSACWR